MLDPTEAKSYEGVEDNHTSPPPAANRNKPMGKDTERPNTAASQFFPTGNNEYNALTGICSTVVPQMCHKETGLDGND